MPQGWHWDETLFRGSAPYYERGRLPYAPGLAEALARALQLDGSSRMIDVGCGPGTIALQLARLFGEVVGVDADAEMLAEAKRRAAELGVNNARWICARAEELPTGLGCFRVATFGRSFHWMDRDRVAALIFTMLEPSGAFVQVFDHDRAIQTASALASNLPYPQPPYEAIQELVRTYPGPLRRAGRSVLRYGTPDREATVLARAGYADPDFIRLPGPPFVVRSAGDLVAATFSNSGSAPHLFGNRLAVFEGELRALIAEASVAGLFAERPGETELRIWRRPVDQ